MKRPTPDQMHKAAQWLESYESDGSAEKEACKVVALWIVEQSDAAELRDLAREAGVPVGAVRKRMRERSK